MRKHAGMVAGLAAVVLVLGGVSVYELGFAGSGGGSGGGTSPGPTSQAPPNPARADAFLAAWSRGDLRAAASDTDNAAQALRDLTALGHDLPVRRLTATPAATGVSAGGELPFQVSMNLGSDGTWRYASSLALVPSGSTWLVHWAPQVINPNLRDGGHLALGSVPPPATASVADQHGALLTASDDPSLAAVLTDVTSHNAPIAAPSGGGQPGAVVQAVDQNGATRDLARVLAPKPATAIRLTIDAGTQQRAQQAVDSSAADAAGVVVLQASTGHILAMANNPANGYDTALRAQVAPGSTMKVIDAAALLTSGAVTPSSAVPCPPQITVDGNTIGNDGNLANQGASFAFDFAQSCNSAFIGLGQANLPGDAQVTEANQVFGFGQPWDIGLGQPTTYGSGPSPGSDQVLHAEDMIGQGNIEMSPLAMASVAATVVSGSFHQPVLLPNAPTVSAGGSLPSGTDSDLRQLMRDVVTNGTATAALGNLPGDIGAKTGTAEVNGQRANNGWLIAYDADHDIAVGCFVQNGGTGVGACGPVVRQILQSDATG